MARPKKSPTTLKTEQLNLRLSPSEKGEIAERAAAANMTLTDFTRASALNRKVQIVQASVPDFATRHELRRIGNNINQTVHLMHIGKAASPVDLLPYLDKLERLFDLWLAYDSKSGKSRA